MTMLLKASLALLPITGCVAVLLIVIQYRNLRKMKNQFSACTVRRGIVQELGVRAPTKMRPYQHFSVICAFPNGNDLLEIPYESGDLNQVVPGDEIPLYIYPNGVAAVVAYDEETTKKKFRQRVIIILALCAVLSFAIPAVGFAVTKLA